MACSARHGRFCSAAHERCVDEYRAARHAAELAREYATIGYRTEMAAYGPIITFKQWLIGLRQYRRMADAA